jgi:hypothetical protein
VNKSQNKIITSRLLILESKRLLLNSVLRRFDNTGDAPLGARVETLRGEAAHAQHVYRTVMLAWGSPEDPDYWLIAYTRLIEMGHALTGKLRDATAQLPVSERYEASADVEMLEEIVANWRESLKTAMAASVA